MKVRVGIIGAGGIADDHCRNIKNCEGAELVAVADSSTERRERVKRVYGLARTYEKWEELVADRDIDAVVVALPNALHAPVALAAIRAGKHVLLEKPFALNYREAKAVADAAKRRRRVLMVGMNQRYVREAQILRALVQRGTLGRVYHAKA